MRHSDRDRIHRMEREDELGISRQKIKKPIMPIKAYKIIKICLICAIPVVYFMYSPLLLGILLCWVALLFITNSLERTNNAGLKKDLQTRFPKTDSILCIIIILLTAVCITVSEVSSSSSSNAFSGMSSSEISSGLSSGKYIWFRIQKILKNVGSCMTGTRVLFQSEMSFAAGGGGGGAEGAPGGGGSITSVLSDIPFSMIFESIIKAVCTALLVVVIILGLLSLRKLKKLGINDEELTEKERIRRIKMEEKRLAKERADRKYHSVKKSDFTQMEQELLQDLSFLFDFDPDEFDEDASPESAKTESIEKQRGIK